MAENRLLDTNVLVYAYDASETRRRAIAKALLDDVWNVGGGVLTLQNLSEFFFAVTRKVQKPVPIVDAKTIVADILRSSRWMVIDRNAGTVMKAMEIVEAARAPFWDALKSTREFYRTLLRIGARETMRRISRPRGGGAPPRGSQKISKYGIFPGPV